MSNDSLLPNRLLSVAIALEGPGEVGEGRGGRGGKGEGRGEERGRGTRKAQPQAEWYKMQVENCNLLRDTTSINHYVILLYKTTDVIADKR